jgi:hypothetical protein
VFLLHLLEGSEQLSRLIRFGIVPVALELRDDVVLAGDVLLAQRHVQLSLLKMVNHHLPLIHSTLI